MTSQYEGSPFNLGAPSVNAIMDIYLPSIPMLVYRIAMLANQE